MYDNWFKHMHNFDDYLAARGQLEAAREPDDPLHNPFTFSSGQDGTPVWSIMVQDLEKLRMFQLGMAGIDVAIPVVGHFDFGLLRNSAEENERGVVELVDVGGGSRARQRVEGTWRTRGLCRGQTAVVMYRYIAARSATGGGER